MKRERPHSPPSQQRISLSIDEAFQLALLLHRGPSLEMAETLYRRIIEAVPEHLDALHFCGVLCHQQNRHGEAARLIGRIIELDPANVDAHNNLGNVLKALNKKKEAASCYRKAIALNPDHAPALNNLGVVLMAQRAVEEALEVYLRAVQASPETPDYHYNLANALRKCGQIDAAVAEYRHVLALEPKYFNAWQGLSHTLVKAQRKEEALQVFDKWLQKDPGNPTARYLQAACKGEDPPVRAPDGYVQKIFDDMADGFDEHMQKHLEYRAPQLLLDAVSGILEPDASLAVLDAGCGTGLCGPLLRPYARHLVGVDLSTGMLACAKGVGVYDELIQAELTEYLAKRTDAYELIFSADTLCYFGDLEPILQAAAVALKSVGVLAFTLEAQGFGGDGWQLNSHGRYAHADVYVARVLAANGFAVQSITRVILRKEGGQPVNGHLVIAFLENS